MNCVKKHIDLCVAIGISLVAAALKIWLLYHTTNGDLALITNSDERAYYLDGAQFIRTLGVHYFFTPRSLWNAPLNPLLIAALGMNVPLAKFVNIFLITAAGLMVWDLARRAGGRNAGLAALVVYSLHRPLCSLSITILSEPLFISLLIAALWCFSRYPRSAWGGLSAGLLMGLAALTRPVVQGYPAAALALLVALRFVPGPWAAELRRAAGKGVLFVAAGYCLLVLPWLFKNYYWLGKAGIANGSGAVLYLGNDLRKDGEEPIFLEMDYDTGDVSREYTHLDTEGDRRLGEAAVAMMKAHPLDAGLLLVRKTFRYLLGGYRHYFYPQHTLAGFSEFHPWWETVWAASDVLFIVCAVFAGIVGLVVCGMPAARFFAGSFVLYMTAVNTLLFPIPRMAVPMFPFLLVFAVSLWTQTVRARVRIATAACIALVFVWLACCGAWYRPAIVTAHYRDYFTTQRAIDPAAPTSSTDLERLGPGKFHAARKHPALDYEFTPLPAALNQVVFIELDVQCSGEPKHLAGHLAWQTTKDAGFDRKQSMDFTLEPGRRIYRLSPSRRPGWSGELKGIQIGLPYRKICRRYEVHAVEISK